jgi:hypothetical protein
LQTVLGLNVDDSANADWVQVRDCSIGHIQIRHATYSHEVGCSAHFLWALMPKSRPNWMLCIWIKYISVVLTVGNDELDYEAHFSIFCLFIFVSYTSNYLYYLLGFKLLYQL